MTKADFIRYNDLKEKIYDIFLLELNKSFEEIGLYSIDYIEVSQNGLEITFNNEHKSLGFYSFEVEVLYTEMDFVSIKELILEKASEEYANQIEIKRKADEEYAKRIKKEKLKKECEDFIKARDLYLKLKDKYAELS